MYYESGGLSVVDRKPLETRE